MVILITGSSHTGKTALAQKILKKYGYTYLSQDHLKMGLIRCGLCTLSAEDSIEKITCAVWPLTREIIKTNIENKQNIIIEGCYIPFEYKSDFDKEYLKNIEYRCLVFSAKYINEHYDDILDFANVVEHRNSDDREYCTRELLLKENSYNLEQCNKEKCDYILIDSKYNVDIELNY